MKRKNIMTSIFILYLLTVCCALRHYAGPAYADSSDSPGYGSKISDVANSYNNWIVPNNRYGNNSEHIDFIKFAFTLNEVNHGEDSDNSVQRMREDKLEMPAYWFYAEGWHELTLDQKRTLVAGCVYFLNQYLREAICINEKMKTTYDHFSARITVEEIVNHVDSLYKIPQYHDEDAENLILDYMQYGFWHYMGLTISYQS